MTKKADKEGRPGRTHPPKPEFEFSVFDFDEFAEWLADRHDHCAAWLLGTAENAREEMEETSPLAKAYQGVGLSVAIDTAYLAMLALAVAYSVREDLADGDLPRTASMGKEAFRRARYMLVLHADRLPVRIEEAGSDGEPSVLDGRASLVAAVLMPVSMLGFECPAPSVPDAVKNMPAAVRATWEEHEYADQPLCQMMALSFWLGFRAIVAEAGQTEAWRNVLDDFWEEWTTHLLDVDYVLRKEDLEANEKLEE